MVEIDDLTLKAAYNGERGAFRRIYDFYKSFVWRILFNMCGRNEEITKEVMQDVFVKVFESLSKFRGESNFSTWLYRIAYTTAMNHLQRKKNNSPIDPEKLVSSEKSDKYEVKQIVLKILSTLTPEDRFLIVAREIEGISFEELSVMMNVSSNSLRTRLHRLKQQIRKLAMFNEEKVEERRNVK